MHTDKNTGILDMNGIYINNGDNVIVFHGNTYPKTPYNCKVIWKHGWKLTTNDKSGNGDNYDVYAWRKSIQVVNSNNRSEFQTYNLKQLKDKWMQKNIGVNISTEERKRLLQCFEDAFRLGQEELIYMNNNVNMESECNVDLTVKSSTIANNSKNDAISFLSAKSVNEIKPKYKKNLFLLSDDEKDRFLKEKVYENIQVSPNGRHTISTAYCRKVAEMIGGNYDFLTKTQKMLLKSDIIEENIYPETKIEKYLKY